MHSGNVGHAQNLDNLVYATTYLRDLDDLAVPIVGFGARHAEVTALANRLEADRVRFLPYQPRDVLTESLGSAHVHYVGLAKGLSGFVVPSRLYGILAAGRPVIVAADADSETARLVNEVDCGVVVPPDRPDLIAAAIRDAHDGRSTSTSWDDEAASTSSERRTGPLRWPATARSSTRSSAPEASECGSSR